MPVPGGRTQAEQELQKATSLLQGRLQRRLDLTAACAATGSSLQLLQLRAPETCRGVISPAAHSCGRRRQVTLISPWLNKASLAKSRQLRHRRGVARRNHVFSKGLATHSLDRTRGMPCCWWHRRCSSGVALGGTTRRGGVLRCSGHERTTTARWLLAGMRVGLAGETRCFTVPDMTTERTSEQ